LSSIPAIVIFSTRQVLPDFDRRCGVG